MSFLLLSLLLSASPSRAAIAIVPPVTEQPETAWLGLSLADDLETRLLEFSVFDHASAKDSFPLSVFSWRQALSASRRARVNTSVLLSTSDGARLAKALGATAVFTATYWVKSTSIKLAWRIVGTGDSQRHELDIPLDDTAKGIERVFSAVLLELNLHKLGVPLEPVPDFPLATQRSYGQALEILREQSLDPRARLVLGNDRLLEAHSLLSQATQTSPQFYRAWVARAIVSAMRGEMRSADEELKEAKQRGPADSPALAIGQFYVNYRKGDLRRAIVMLGTALNTHLGFLLGLGYLGEAYLQAGLPNEASRLFALYGERVPNNPWVGLMHAESLATLGRTDAALTELRTLARRFPDNLDILTGLAARQADEARFAEARQTIARGLSLSPENAALLARLAHIEIEGGKLDVALGLLQRAVKGVDDSRGEPSAGYPYLVYGRCLALLGRTEEAVSAFRSAGRIGVAESELKVLRQDQRLAEVLADQRVPFWSK